MFSKKVIGIDVSDKTVEIVEIRKRARGYFIEKANRLYLPDGVIEKGKIKDKEKLKEAFKRLFEQAKPGPIKGTKVNFFIRCNYFWHSLLHRMTATTRLLPI